MRLVATFLIVINILGSCGGESSSVDKKEKSLKEPDEASGASTGAGEKQLNINVLWDLSDRIDSSKNPSSPQHYERDIEVIKTIAGIFRSDMKKKGAYKAKGKLRVFFSPAPRNPSINNIAKNLAYDLSSYSGDGANKKKREIYDSVQNRFSRNLNLIYELTINDNKGKKQWDGSDIWRFFKNDASEYCIERDSSYRNVLVILTDGYIYHKDSRMKNANRTSYILPEVVKPFRRNDKWKEQFDNGDYGLITTRKDLRNLEVLVLEINPSGENKNDEDFIKIYLSKWFVEMGIEKGNYEVYNSDLPEYTKGKIKHFFDRR